jgi:hypothetical protein
MINFRFHIVSITAIFLAFAIGLVLGTNFLADASKDFLERRIEDFNDRLNDADARNDELSAQISALENEDEQLDEEVGERLFTGLLDADPVLVIAPRGLTGEPGPVDRVNQSLDQADADALGVWWLTDRLALDDEDEVNDLAAALDVAATDAATLRQDLSTRLADVLAGSTDAPASDGDVGNAEEPSLLARLVESGFVDYELPEGSDEDVVQLPASDLRVSVVTGRGASVPNDEVLLPMLQALADEGPVPVVVSETPATADDVDDGEVPEPLVAQIRGDGTLRERITTVDDMEQVSGRIATVLALQDVVPGGPRIGQYGLRDDAQRLLPAPPE